MSAPAARLGITLVVLRDSADLHVVRKERVVQTLRIERLVLHVETLRWPDPRDRTVRAWHARGGRWQSRVLGDVRQSRRQARRRAPRRTWVGLLAVVPHAFRCER